MPIARLRRYYNFCNKRYFGNRLPRRPHLGFRPMRGKLAETIFDIFRREHAAIFINKRMRWSPDTVKLCLLHEMNHLSLPNRFEHGPAFQKGMLRLAKAGALRGVW